MLNAEIYNKITNALDCLENDNVEPLFSKDVLDCIKLIKKSDHSFYAKCKRKLREKGKVREVESAIKEPSLDIPCPADLSDEFFRYKKSKITDYRIVSYQDQIYHYDGEKYDQIPDRELETDIVAWLKNHPLARIKSTPRLARDILGNLKANELVPHKLRLPCWLNDKTAKVSHIIPTQSTLIDCKAFDRGVKNPTIERTNEFFCTQLIPIKVDLNASCESFLRMLETSQPDENVRKLIQEWFGLNLVNTMEYQKAVIMRGEGRNGKSVLLTVLRELLGEHNYSSITLDAMSGSRTFPLAQMDGKLANICEEMSDVDKTAEGILKQLITGGSLTVERKNKDPFNMTPTARLTFATNVLPHFRDRSEGIWRRLIIIPFKVQIPLEKQNRQLTDPEFWWKSGELPGIFNWALAGLVRLKLRGRFDEPEVCVVEKRNYQLDCNHAKQFLEMHVIANEGEEVAQTFLFQEYRNWCESNGYKPLTSQNFNNEVERIFPNVEKTKNAIAHNGGRHRVWRGLELVP